MEYFFILIHISKDTEDKILKIESFLHRINELLTQIFQCEDFIIRYQQTKILFLSLICLYSLYLAEIDFQNGEVYDNVIKKFFEISYDLEQKLRIFLKLA